MAVAPIYPSPQPGASLLLSFTPPVATPQTLLLISASRLSALRAFVALEAGYNVVVAALPSESWDVELLSRLSAHQISSLSLPETLTKDADEAAWGQWLDSVPSEVTRSCFLVALNDTFPTASPRRSFASASAFKKAASARRYLVNIADAPRLSDFSWPSTHRFPLDSSSTSARGSGADASGEKSGLQLAITTNSSACRLATRIKREVVASLPSNVGASVRAVSDLRRSLREMGDKWDGDEDEVAGVGFNRPVEQLSREKSEQLAHASSSNTESWTAQEVQRTRMRYVAQISEYWPLDRLASANLSTLSSPSTPISSTPKSSSPSSSPTFPSHHSLLLAPPPPPKGRIVLLGTGPGSPLLLTRLAHLFLTSPPGSPYHVDLFLSDKLVPPEILALIPSAAREGVVIARKYPGNAEHAQDELMRLAVEGASRGQTVLRMKQGDPFLYGRGGEEVLHFRQAGFEPLVVPGLSSCLAGPALAGIPVTQRGVAESMVVCTGVGRGGKSVLVDGYSRSRTLVILMGVARLEALVASLLLHPGSPYPPYLPIALVERASSPDQRVVASTIEALAGVLGRLPPHRPPGMLVVGWGVMCLQGTEGKGDMTVLDLVGEEEDRKRVKGWLGPEGYCVTEGLGEGWRNFVGRVEA